jgi:uncharacterized protein (DUF1501 family)
MRARGGRHVRGVLRDHLGAPAGALNGSVFPDGATASPIDGLVA